MAPRYLPRTHSDSWGLIFHRLICLEHAKLINMGRSLTYHHMQIHHASVHTHMPPTHTHEKLNPRGENEIMGTTLVRKWGRRPDLKKRKEQRLRYVECCQKRSNFCATFIQVCGLILAYGTLCAAPSGKNTRKYLHASDYSAVTAKNDIFAPVLTIKHLHFIRI